MSSRPRMSPQDRVRMAQELRHRGISQPGLTQGQRKNARRVSSNLVKLNALEAKRQRQ